jgi:hypothetical protein
MESYVGKKQFMAMIGSILLGILLFGFQNFANVSTEVNAPDKSQKLSCPYIMPSAVSHTSAKK